jgi:methylamine dehydrogenase light chain
MKTLSDWIDAAAERRARRSAQLHGRRTILARLGQWMVGVVLLPTLPFDRSTAHAAAPKQSPDTACEYWRNCAIDGFLCTCCGGSVSQCPPGTEVSTVTWVGTCRNPTDRTDYLISYYDCCGKPSCGRCLCNNNERERPGYQMGVHNDINWCMANASTAYHCTVSAIVGIGKK